MFQNRFAHLPNFFTAVAFGLAAMASAACAGVVRTASAPAPAIPAAGDTAAEYPTIAAWPSYTNTALGYTFAYPQGWQVDEQGLAQPNKEVLLIPPDAEPFLSYFSVLYDSRKMEQILALYAETLPEAPPAEVTFASRPAVQFQPFGARLEIYLPVGDSQLLVTTDSMDDPEIQKILSSFALIP